MKSRSIQFPRLTVKYAFPDTTLTMRSTKNIDITAHILNDSLRIETSWKTLLRQFVGTAYKDTCPHTGTVVNCISHGISHNAGGMNLFITTVLELRKGCSLIYRIFQTFVCRTKIYRGPLTRRQVAKPGGNTSMYVPVAYTYTAIRRHIPLRSTSHGGGPSHL